MSKTQRDKGKRFEVMVAHLTGGKRHIRADYSESAPDVETDTFLIECKHYKSIAAIRFLEQATVYTERDPKARIPLVMMREDRGPVVAMILASDFLALVNMKKGTDDVSDL